MKNIPALPALALAALITGLPPEARASEITPHVALDFGFNTRSHAGANLTTWAPNLSAFARVDDELAISLDWGLTALDADSVDGTGVESLNPFLGAHATPSYGPLQLRLGLGVALPIAEADSDGEVEAYRSARAIRGGWDPWLYRPDTFSVAVPIRAELTVAPPLLIAGEGAIFLLLGTAAGAEEHLGFQGALEATARLGLFDVGARVQAVTEERDDAQVSLEPFARVRLGPVGIHGRLTLNLDEPDGFSFNRGGIWGAHLGVAFYY